MTGTCSSWVHPLYPSTLHLNASLRPPTLPFSTRPATLYISPLVFCPFHSFDYWYCAPDSTIHACPPFFTLSEETAATRALVVSGRASFFLSELPSSAFSHSDCLHLLDTIASRRERQVCLESKCSRCQQPQGSSMMPGTTCLGNEMYRISLRMPFIGLASHLQS